MTSQSLPARIYTDDVDAEIRLHPSTSIVRHKHHLHSTSSDLPLPYSGTRTPSRPSCFHTMPLPPKVYSLMVAAFAA